MFYHLRIHRDKTPPLRKHGLFSFLTLAGCVALIAFIDVALAPDIVHSLSAGMVSRNALRLLVALIVVSPVAAAIARRTLVRRNSIVTLEGSDNSWSRFLSRAEFTMIGLLSIAAYTELHMATHGRGSLWVVHWHAVSPEHALFCFMALLACVRASGRWVNMHWSCRLQAPNQFVVQLPIRAWMLLTALTMLQLLTLAYLIGWTTLLALWPLALSP